MRDPEGVFGKYLYVDMPVGPFFVPFDTRYSHQYTNFVQIKILNFVGIRGILWQTAKNLHNFRLLPSSDMKSPRSPYQNPVSQCAKTLPKTGTYTYTMSVQCENHSSNAYPGAICSKCLFLFLVYYFECDLIWTIT